jgi:Zn-dependent peptidase ImmA (M78 family)
LEWQANTFASELLMPRAMVLAEWNRVYPSRKSISLAELEPHQRKIMISEMVARGSVRTDPAGVANVCLEHVARPLSQTFQVSPQAMRIRLEKVGFLTRRKASELTLQG